MTTRSKLAEEFFDAVLCGDAAAVRRLVAAGVDPDVPDRSLDGETPALVTAARRGNAEMLRVLLALGAAPEARARDAGGDGVTALMAAAESIVGGDPPAERVRVLLAAGADPGARDADGRTPLFYCSDAETVRLLLDAGADPHVRDARGATALFHAVRWHAETARVVLDAGVDAGVRDDDGWTALMHVQRHGSPLARRDVAPLLSAASGQASGDVELVQAARDGEAAAARPVPETASASLESPPLRGLATDRQNSRALLLRASVPRVAAALAALSPTARIDEDVAGRPVVLGERGYLVYRPVGSAWTLVQSSHLPPDVSGVFQGTVARRLSRELASEVVLVLLSDTAETVQYELWRGGELLERYAAGDQVVFESRLRPAPPSTRGDAGVFLDAFLRDHEAWIPDWSDRARRGSPGAAVTYFADAAGPAIERADHVVMRPA